MKKITIELIGILTSVLFFVQCEKESSGLISTEQEIELGRQLDSLILNSPDDYVVVTADSFPEAYTFLNDMMDEILVSEDLQRGDEFEYQIRIIDEDVLNAFAAPGGYLYFYTGLMKYLDNGAQLAGVMAHEIAHVDRRHTARKIEVAYTIDAVLAVVFGSDTTKLEQIAGSLAKGLGSLAFSREQEYEADEYAVRYTSDTPYHPKGISGFFEKMNESEQGGRVPEFLSTHPDPGNRIEAINKVWEELESPEGDLFINEYNAFKQQLPE